VVLVRVSAGRCGIGDLGSGAVTEAADERHAGWLELFYDLMFVALVAQLAHPLVGHPGAGSALTMLVLFAPAWWLWVSSTLYLNLFGEGGAQRRIAVLAQMACLLVMAGGAGEAAEGHPALFAGVYAVSRAGLLAVRFALRRKQPQGGSNVAAAVSLVLWAASILLQPPLAYLLWAGGLAVEIGAVVYRRSGASIQVSHLVERFGLFVIIVLGEGVAQLVGALVAAHSSPHAVLAAVVAFGILGALWWLYFDFGSAVAEAALRARPEDAFPLARRIFVLGHFLPVGALVAVAAGLGALVGESGSGPSPAGTVRLICAALMVYLLNNAFLGLTAVGHSAVAVLRWLLPMTAILVGLAVFGGGLDPLAQLALVFLALAGTTIVNRVALPRKPLPGQSS
jgi:low temperature requirement protein LtrA